MLEYLLEFLSEDECTRADRYHLDQDRRRYVIGRGVVRCILGKYLGIPASQLEFEYGTCGKPYLQNAYPYSLHFNISHSQELALLGVCWDREIGVDLEYIPSILDWEEIADRFFSSHECENLFLLPKHQQIKAFFDAWTRKEAYAKATGKGLSIPLDSYEVSLVPNEPAQLISTAWKPDDVNNWSMSGISIQHGYSAAVVVQGRTPSFQKRYLSKYLLQTLLSNK